MAYKHIWCYIVVLIVTPLWNPKSRYSNWATNKYLIGAVLIKQQKAFQGRQSVWLWGVKMVVWHTVCVCACDCVYVAIMVSHWDDTNYIPVELSNPFTISVCISVCSALYFTSAHTFSPLHALPLSRSHPCPAKFSQLSLKCKHITTRIFYSRTSFMPQAHKHVHTIRSHEIYLKVLSCWWPLMMT